MPDVRTRQTIAFLRAILAGERYAHIARAHGLSHGAVEHRIKRLARRLHADGALGGIHAGTLNFIGRMRKHADQINRALDRLEAGEIRPRAHAPRPRRDLTQEEIATLLRRAGNRSAAPLRDTALVHFLLVTAARPVEVARMQIAHYLHADGTVREYSVLPADMTQSGGERRFVFVNAASVDAIDAYLEDRLRAKGRQPDTSEAYRGFSPSEPLFLNNAGLPFAVVEKAGRKGKRHTSPQMADALAKILGKSGLQGIQLETLRHILAARLRKRGATIKQICEIFGVSGKKSAIRLLPPALTFSELMADIFPGAAGFPDRDPGSH